MKIVFIRDFSPRKKGEVAEFNTRDEVRTAEYYLANNIAQLCACSKQKEGCADCAKKEVNLSDLKVVELMEIAETLSIEVASGTKKAILIELIKTAQEEK